MNAEALFAYSVDCLGSAVLFVCEIKMYNHVRLLAYTYNVCVHVHCICVTHVSISKCWPHQMVVSCTHKTNITDLHALNMHMSIDQRSMLGNDVPI